jgi:hypothetical protein
MAAVGGDLLAAREDKNQSMVPVPVRVGDGHLGPLPVHRDQDT